MLPLCLPFSLLFVVGAVIDPTLIPEALRRGPRWALWKSIHKPGEPKPRKVPQVPIDQPALWRNFDEAFEDYLRMPGRWSGLMRAFDESDDIVGIDCDKCYSSGDRSLSTPWAREIEERFRDTFCERSWSRLGFHVFCFARLSRSVQYTFHGANGEAAGGIELYSSRRYFVVTADPLPDSPLTLAAHQADVDSLVEALVRLREEERNRQHAQERAVNPQHVPIEWTGSLDQLELQLVSRYCVLVPIRPGARHNTLLRMLGTMWRRGVPALVAEHALQELNAKFCDPPYAPSHITAMVRSAERWPR